MIVTILRDFKDRLFSLMAFSAGGLITIIMYLSLYPAMHDAMAQFQNLYDSFPKGFYQAFGIENFSIVTVENYLAIEYFSVILPLLVIFFAASRAGSALAGEIEKGITGIYLMLPIGRSSLYLAKYASGLIAITVFTLATVTCIIPLASLFAITLDGVRLWQVTGMTLLFGWSIYALGMCLSALFSERSKLYMIIGGFVFGMYVIKIIAGLKNSWEWLQHYSIFYYFGAQDILNKGEINNSSFVVFGISILIFSMLGWVVFTRRDILV